ncbi:hydrogenase nickel incorporation protein HypB [Desulfobulbus propionicus]|jgi:hydrogenase nickel incorporation protein HypB
MCDTCGCQLHEHHQHDTKVVEVNRSLLEANQKQAHSNRHHIESMGALAINMISSPGSGKTTLLERTIEALKETVRIGVIEGDIETERDADRIRAKGVPAVQLTTGGACHLDAPMVHGGLHVLEHFGKGQGFDLIFIENVGNLVCPATFDLGEHRRIILLSVPEGSDKPAKYPATFRGADLVLITKTDLLPYFDFSVEEAEKETHTLKPDVPIIELSATTGKGFDRWIDYLKQMLATK